MTPTELIAIAVAVVSMATSIYTQINAASAAQQKQNTEQLDAQTRAKKAEAEAADAAAKVAQARADADAEERARRDRIIDEQFERLQSENKRLADNNLVVNTALLQLRAENDQLYAAHREMRTRLALRDEAVAKLERDLASEKGHRAQLDAWVDLLVAAMTAANIPIPKKPGTGALPALPTGGA